MVGKDDQLPAIDRKTISRSCKQKPVTAIQHFQQHLEASGQGYTVLE